MSLTLRIERKVVDRFRLEAKKRFPKEAYAILLGIRFSGLPGGYYVSDLWVPKDVDKYSTHSEVTPPESWAIAANLYAYEEKVRVVGDIHSHPYYYKSCNGKLIGDEPSAGDWEIGWKDICGITCVAEQKDGSLRTRTKFFGPAIPVKAEIIKVA